MQWLRHLICSVGQYCRKCGNFVTNPSGTCPICGYNNGGPKS